jgi:competence protein ComEC
MIYVCVGGILLWPLAQAMQKAAFPELKLWVLDVGQGDGLWIETPGGHHIVVDAGAKTGSGDQGKWTLVPFAQWLGVSSIDALVLTHADLDHVGGALSLMKKISVGSIWTNPQDLANPKPELAAVLAEAQSRNIPVLPWTAGQTLRFADGVVLQGLHPILGREFAEGNHASVTLLLEYAGRRALLTGDLEEEGEEEFLVNWPNLQIDLLKAGHHGSKNATSAELLEQTRPEWALISAGRNNRYHHPHPDVVARLTQRGIGLLGTYDWGALQWSVDSKGQMLLKRHLAGELIRGN